jgi:hypothetical protein
MSEEELCIMNFLQTSPHAYCARKEIARRAVRRQVYEENPHWPNAALAGLLGQGKIEQNESGLYRIKSSDRSH